MKPARKTSVDYAKPTIAVLAAQVIEIAKGEGVGDACIVRTNTGGWLVHAHLQNLLEDLETRGSLVANLALENQLR